MNDKEFANSIKLYNLIEKYIKFNLEENLEIKKKGKDYYKYWNEIFKELKKNYIKKLEAKK